LVEGLVDSGCLVRHCPTIDNRSHLIRLTERGRDLQQRVAYALGVDAEIIAQFFDEDVTFLVGLLSRFYGTEAAFGAAKVHASRQFNPLTRRRSVWTTSSGL
jgi:hypothetical protein